MVGALKRNFQVIAVAIVTALVTAGGPAIAHGVRHALFAHNADKVDGKHAVSSGASVNQRKGKLVATNRTSGLLPDNIISKVHYGRLDFTDGENIFTLRSVDGEQVVASVTVNVPGASPQLVEVTGNFLVWDFGNSDCAGVCEVDYFLDEQGTASGGERWGFVYVDSAAGGSGGQATISAAFTAAPGSHTYELKARSFGNPTDAMNIDGVLMSAQTVPFDAAGGTPSPIRSQSKALGPGRASRR